MGGDRGCSGPALPGFIFFPPPLGPAPQAILPLRLEGPRAKLKGPTPDENGKWGGRLPRSSTSETASGRPRSLVGLWAPSTFYLSLQRMLEDKRNIWTSELIYIFGRATFPFLKRGERAPYPALGGRTAASFDAPGSSSARRRGARRPAEIAALPDIYLFGGKGRQRARRPSQTREETQPLGWDLQGASVKARPQPAALPAPSETSGASLAASGC